MKSKIRILLLCMCNIVVFNVAGCWFNDDVTYIEYAFEERMESSSIVIIRDEDSLEQFIDSKNMSDEMEQSLLEYDKEYFQDDMIIVISHWETSGSNAIEVDNVEIKDSVIEVTLERETSDDATDDMKNWGIIIEIEKNSDIKEAKVRVDEE